MTFSDQYFRFQRNSIVLVENDKNENVFSRSTDFLNKTKENTSMSTAPIDSGGSGGGLHRLLSRISNISQRANSVGVTEIGTSLSTGSSIESNPTDQENVDHSWIKHFNQIDRLFSGSLLQLIYRAIDISLLLTGLLSNSSPCETSNHFGITSICLLIFYFIDIFIIFLLFLRNISSRHLQMSEEQKNDQLRRALVLRGFFTFFKLIPIAVGTAYVFPSSSIKPVECNSMRFYLGLVCMSTWLIILIPPSKPEVPVRRSFILELFVLLFVLIINLTYIGTVARSISGVNQTSCLYHQMNDMYYGAPLKSFAYVGLILFSCTTLIHLIHVFVNQICFRLSTQRQRWFISYYAFQYTLNYFSAIVVIYYFSTGALILFQPVEGEPCRNSAPDLYRILLIWEWIRILSPLIVLPLLIIFCCLGVCFGIIFSFCLPPSITVPLLESLRGWTLAAPLTINPNPPATQAHIDSLPTASFGHDVDPFNQTDCVICRTTFESNEQLKKLQCGHLFHPECVSNWLMITRICPVCRQRMT